MTAYPVAAVAAEPSVRTIRQRESVPFSDRRAVLSLPPVANTPTFYPQSIWYDQLQGNADDDVLTPRNVYRLKPSERLEVGKYVADPDNSDFSNPKYKPRSRSSSRPPRLSDTGSRVGEEENTTDDESGEEPPASAEPRRRTNSSTVRLTYPVVLPNYPNSAASLFFPIYYGRPSVRDKADPRGLPQAINEQFHPNDRAGIGLSSIAVQENNLNRMCLFKIGPGAVAFKVVINAFEAAGMRYTPSNSDFNILWAKRATPYTLGSLTAYQKVNHFPGTWGIGRKDSLAQNCTKMQRYFGVENFDIIPASFLIPRQEAELRLNAERFPGTEESPLIYIVKPSASSCGRGIHLYKGIPPMSLNSAKQKVCQRYIGNPLLIFGRKFDLRMYCVVTGFDPLRIYLFDEGLVRFAAEKYPGPDKDLQNIHMHLTNYSVNKTAQLSAESRGRDADGDLAVDIKWCISDMKRHLAREHPLGEAAWPRIEAECEDVVVKAFLSIEHEVIERVRAECKDKTGRNCFELFGLDLMADDQLKVRLIEVNIMPSLATGATLDKAVKARMLAHMLTLVRAVPCVRGRVNNPGSEFVPRGAAPERPERMYKFGKHPLASARIQEHGLLRAFNDPSVPESMLSTAENLMLVEAEEELACAGGFRRIFPAAATVQQYLPLFTHGVRRNNFLLASATLMAEGKKSK